MPEPFLHLPKLLKFWDDIQTVFGLVEGELNIVSGVEAVTARILHLLLTRRGEDPIHPDMGLAPDLFAPFSFSAASALAYQTEQLLIEWNDHASIGIKQLQV